jgi:hypothetical protein
MLCAKCEQPIEKNWQFCPSCGHTQTTSPEPGKNAQDSTTRANGGANTGKGSKDISQDSPYGSGIRQQVFEVIVRQAIAGAPWRMICKGPMQTNNISEEEIEAEMARRGSSDSKAKNQNAKETEEASFAPPPQPKGETIQFAAGNSMSDRIKTVAAKLKAVNELGAKRQQEFDMYVRSLLLELDKLLKEAQNYEQSQSNSNEQLERDLEREAGRIKNEPKREDPPAGPHHVDC